MIADATLPDLPITYANQRFEELTGYTSDEILGRNCRFLQGADTDAETVTKFREALAAATRFQGEILNYRKDERFLNGRFLMLLDSRNVNRPAITVSMSAFTRVLNQIEQPDLGHLNRDYDREKRRAVR